MHWYKWYSEPQCMQSFARTSMDSALYEISNAFNSTLLGNLIVKYWQHHYSGYNIVKLSFRDHMHPVHTYASAPVA